jgi:hypothetical protein
MRPIVVRALVGLLLAGTGLLHAYNGPVRGIYISGFVAGSPKIFNPILDHAQGTLVNTMVVHVKDEWGNIHTPTQLPLAKEIGMYSGAIRDLPAFVKKVHDRNFYLIAKIDCYKNKKLAETHPELAVKNRKTGAIWADDKGFGWMDPYSRVNWDLNAGLAMELAQAGFDEIQFDYVRFPDGGTLANCLYAANVDSHPKTWAIESFLGYAAQKLSAYPTVQVSADVFGMTCWRQLGEIGQTLPGVGKQVNSVGPMIYPSHFPNSFYSTQKILYDDPYRVIKESCVRGVKLLEGTNAKLRPWLQGFGYKVKNFDYRYVVAQIKAVQDAGLDEWFIWNAGCKYGETWKALEELRSAKSEVRTEEKKDSL